MSYLDAVLIAEARRTGRGQRSAQFRHVHLTKKPLGLLLWQLGAEPFTAAAVAWGFGPRQRSLVVSGEPRDRELVFRALTEVAKAFNPWFEGGALGEPQLVVPNWANLTLLGRLGRRLAYLPTDGEHPADPELVRFGRHLAFLAERAYFPGQQLIVVLTDLLASHWVTELSSLEAQHLPAFDAAIEPPKGRTAHEAAADAERVEIGPLPNETDDAVVDRLLDHFNRERQRRTDVALIAKLLPPFRAHYSTLVDRGWPLLWATLDRERAYPAAEHVERRWQDDLQALGRHLGWVVGKGGRRRTRQTAAQAAYTLRRWEEGQELWEAEVAIDDPLKMLPYELAGKAFRGMVSSVDLENREKAKVKVVARPLVSVRTRRPCMVPPGTSLQWTKMPGGAAYKIVEIEAHRSGSTVTLMHLSGSLKAERPVEGEVAAFSIHHMKRSPPLMLPKKVPWTHRTVPSEPPSLEDPETARGWE